MICPECNGTGKTVYFVEVDRDENIVTCEKREGICRTCYGSGQKRMTNGDKIRALSNKDLAYFVAAKAAHVENYRMIEKGYMPTATQLSVLREQLYMTIRQWLESTTGANDGDFLKELSWM